MMAWLVLHGRYRDVPAYILCYRIIVKTFVLEAVYRKSPPAKALVETRAAMKKIMLILKGEDRE